MPSSNATPSVNGWFFQISAGMFLFLRNIKTSKTLKIEGPSEDIEIETEDGLIYAQAKCLNDIKARDSVPAHYKKALKSLKSNQGKAAKLIIFPISKTHLAKAKTNSIAWRANLSSIS